MTGSTSLAKSIQQRLKEAAKRNGEPVDVLFQRYAYERFLFRLDGSRHRDRFILKGGQLFLVWEQRNYRYTADVDLLGTGDPALMSHTFTEVCGIPCEDGMHYDTNSISAAPIALTKQYPGIAIQLMGYLGNVRQQLRFDIGFGDIVSPAPMECEFPALLDYPAPRIRVYPPETMIAEKLEAIARLGLFNSRLKDFYDIWMASERFTFELPVLDRAIKTTFACRGTDWGMEIVGLSPRFTDDPGHQSRWRAFLKKSKCHTDPGSLSHIVDKIKFFLEPILTGEQGRMNWQPDKGWQPQGNR